MQIFQKKKNVLHISLFSINIKNIVKQIPKIMILYIHHFILLCSK